ncbi:MAG: hypothetical protein CMF67_06455 [Magnetovibrio sp.]|nr:hypothetical protein [Magnetovibrio sp.]|tara:strand:- start:289 stop:495 length:207 start_codon:yes stop_codon:yes gene_type:complete
MTGQSPPLKRRSGISVIDSIDGQTEARECAEMTVLHIQRGLDIPHYGGVAAHNYVDYRPFVQPLAKTR